MVKRPPQTTAAQKPAPAFRPSPQEKASLTMELAIAMALLLGALIPLAYSFSHERTLLRAYYNQAVAMSILDGELEVLRAGEWRSFSEGTHAYTIRADSAKNLSPGRFVLTREAQQLRLEWLPDRKHSGGRLSREVTLP